METLSTAGTRMAANFDELPNDAFLREAQLLNTILPVAKSTLWRMVRDKRFPAPSRIAGQRITVWRVGDIRAWVKEQSENGK